MNYQDNKRIQTAEELRKVFDLDSLKKDRKAISVANNGLTKIENEQENILKSIIINVGNILETQSEISLWFFNGIPSLDNLPCSDWQDLSDHLGDLYYDRDTGYVYIFKLNESSYEWIINNDASLIQAMSLSNASIDSYDNVRKVFFTTPVTPYDCGDWFVINGNLYICQISKIASEVYDPNDFIIASKYTDDTKANELQGTLTIVSGQVTTIIQNLETISQTIEDDRYYINEVGEKILIAQTTSQLVQKVNSFSSSITNIENVTKELSEIKQTTEELELNFQKIGGANLIPNSSGQNGTVGYYMAFKKPYVEIATLTDGMPNQSVTEWCYVIDTATWYMFGYLDSKWGWFEVSKT